MGKQDRYNLEGADDSFESDTAAVETTSEEPTTEPKTEKEQDSSRSDEIPHRVRYDSPKDGRKAKTFYLDTDEDLARLRELQSLAETEFEETVHRLDVYLAAFRSDLSDDGFLQEMQRMGYGYFD
ncbi:hypothetical protein [Halalkalicoccus salilacus]|uniref:hypothetical protein n=1 Tax=Halalkalicoccus salilacus TaxID=3117459 RepID=UPI00300EE753